LPGGCADPTIVSIEAHYAEGCDDKVTDEATLASIKAYQTRMNQMIMTTNTCKPVPEAYKKDGVASYYKNDDCVGAGVNILGYKTSECKDGDEVDLPSDLKDKANIVEFGECKKTLVAGKAYYLIFTNAKAMAASFAAATLAVSASLF
jgi:hypothetical protein